MEITRKNFKESLEVIETAINECSFLAFDGEFTGLNHAGMSHAAIFDTPEERYYKVVQGASDFLLNQFGFCTFSYDGTTKTYTAKPFNFYVFPRPFSRAAPDVRFTCQSSSLDFLMSQGFDFNKWISEGVSYLRPVDEASLKDQIIKKHEVLSSPAFISPSGGSQPPGINKSPVEIPPEQKDFVDDICKRVEKFLESGEHESYSLPPCNGFQRKLTYQSLEAKFGSDIHLQGKTNDKKERYIVVTKIKDSDDVKRIEENKQAQDLAEVDDAVGFTKVIKMISQSGKLIVGHNMLLDVAHTIHQFLYPLPQDYEEFKSMCHCVFPRMIDTKLMSNTQPFKDRVENSGLSYLHTLTQMPPFVKPEVVLPEEWDNKYKTEMLHEAGYDAYITGQCFIALSNYLGQCQSPPTERIPPGSPLLQPFLNKIFMMRSLDIPYMDLCAPDLNPARDHVFHITFPKEWKNSDISQLFAQFGNVHIGWIDDVSAYVALNSKSVANYVLKTLCKKGSVYRIRSYNDHKNPKYDEGTINPYKYVRPKSNDNGDVHHDMTDEKKGVKREHSVEPEDNDSIEVGSAKKAKTLNVDAPEFTPTSTPEKEEELQWPDNINSSEKKVGEESTKSKLFTEPDDW
ncbi:hypothetical protein ACF0H5_001758 [Mactra antiquata]